jgi:surface polysaccharide O-acyltransferase-like enzyme
MNPYLSLKIKYLSFVLMILVVILHAYNLNQYDNRESFLGFSQFVQTLFGSGIATVAVPLFFLISGYLFFFNFDTTSKPFSEKIVRRFHTLVIPYLLTSLWGLFLFFALQSLPYSSGYFNSGLIRDFSFNKVISTIFLNPMPYQLWFIRDLFVMTILSPIIYYGIKFLKLTFVLIAFMPWVFGVDPIILSSISLPFFITGSYLALRLPEWVSFKHQRKKIYLTYVWLMLMVLRTILEVFNLTDPIVIDILHKVTILVGMVACWQLYDNLFDEMDINKRHGTYLFDFTFFLFLFHEPILTVIKKILKSILGKTELSSMVVYLATPVITIVLVIMVGVLLKKHVPKVFAVITGNR